MVPFDAVNRIASRVKHNAAAFERGKRRRAPQAWAVSLGDRANRPEINYVQAEKVVGEGMGPYTVCKVLGKHVGPAGAPVGAAKVGVSPAMNLRVIAVTCALPACADRRVH